MSRRRLCRVVLSAVALTLAAGCGAIAAVPSHDAGPDATGAAPIDAAVSDVTAAETASSSVVDAALDATADAADADAVPQAPECDGPCVIAFASGPDWESYAGDIHGIDGADLGMAKDVCYSPTSPANCPTGALVYTSGGGSGWTVSLATIPGAYWIWRGDTTTTDIIADLAVAVFQKTFLLGAEPSGMISIAADDYAEIMVNGGTVGVIGSVTDVTVAETAQSPLHSYDLTPFLRPGENTITIVGQNGPGTFAGCSPCTYASNPAGVVFGGTLGYP